MRRTFERMIQGDESLINHVRLAKRKWEEIMNDPNSNDLQHLSRLIESKQTWFENNCSQSNNPTAHWQGQEIMTLTAIARYYSCAVGFDDNLDKAKHVYNAIANSGCSVEVKIHAKKIAELYDLLEDQEENE